VQQWSGCGYAGIAYQARQVRGPEITPHRFSAPAHSAFIGNVKAQSFERFAEFLLKKHCLLV
jgi:hypothetical protein